MAAKPERKAEVDRGVMTVVVAGKTLEFLPVDQIRADGGTQMRAGMNEETLAEYQEAWLDFSHQRNGLLKMPPIIVYYDGSEYWLADGFHRLEAYKRFLAGPSASASPHTIRAEVRSGDRRQAILHAAGANSDHGLRRTNADKRRAVETLLRDEEWGAWSDNEIAKRCHVSHPFVGQLRASLVTVTSEAASERTYTTRHGTEAKMKTANIGKKATPESVLSPAAQATPALPVPPPLTLDQTIAWLWTHIKHHCVSTVAEERLFWLRIQLAPIFTLAALPGADRTIPANLQAAAERIERELEGVIEHDRKTEEKQQAQQSKPTMPPDLAALGWHLLTLPSGKMYAYNGREQKSTQPANEAKTVIEEVYGLQQNLAPQPDERLQQRRRYHLEAAIAHLRQAVDVAPAEAALYTAMITQLEEALA